MKSDTVYNSLWLYRSSTFGHAAKRISRLKFCIGIESLLVREAKVDAECGIYETSDALLLVDAFKRIHIRGVELHRLQVLLYPRWSDGLWQSALALVDCTRGQCCEGVVERSWRLTLVTDQDGARADVVLLGHLLNALLLE